MEKRACEEESDESERSNVKQQRTSYGHSHVTPREATDRNKTHRQTVMKVFQCGRIILIELLQQLVKDSKPSDVNGEWTLDDFLHQHRVRIEKEIESGTKARLFFPAFGTRTDIEIWDLQMLSFIIKRLCNMNERVSTNFRNLHNLRDELVERGTDDGNEGLDDIRAARLNDLLDNFKIDIKNNKVLDKIDRIAMEISQHEDTYDSPQYTHDLKLLHEWYEQDQNMAQKVAEIKKEIGATSRQSSSEHAEIKEAIDSSAQSLSAETSELRNGQLEILRLLREHLPNGFSIQRPETNITINIKNYFGDDESKISDLLAHLIEEEIVNPNGKIPNSEPNPEMSQAIQRALKRFLDISDHTFVQKQCVVFTVRCRTNSALLDLLDDGINGQLTEIFKPVELEIRKIKGMENVELDVQITEKEFWRCVRNIAVQLIPRTAKLMNMRKIEGKENDMQICFDIRVISPTAKESTQFDQSLRDGSKQDTFAQFADELRSCLNMKHLDIGLQFEGKEIITIKGSERAASSMSSETTEISRKEEVPNHDNEINADGAVGCAADMFEFRVAKLSELSEISVRADGDSGRTWVTQIRLLAPDKLLVVDHMNSSVKVVNVSTKTVTSKLRLSCTQMDSWDVAILEKDQAVVTLPKSQKIQVISIRKELLRLRNFKVNGNCFGVGATTDKLVVSFQDPAKIEVINLFGDICFTFNKNLEEMPLFEEPSYVTMSEHERETAVYVSDFSKNSITKFSLDGSVLSVFTDNNWLGLRGMAPVSEDQFFVCNYDKSTVDLVSSNGRNIFTVLNESHGILLPQSICYCPKRHVIFVGSDQGNSLLKVFELEK